MNKILTKLYYVFKPAIPRRLQIALRRAVALRRRVSCSHVWPIDERANGKPEKWPGWPNGKQFALVLTHDVETALGQEKCRDLANMEERLGFRSSFNFVAEAFSVSRDLHHELERRGFEIGVHGLTHDGSLYHSRESFKEQAMRINQYLAKWNCIGFRSPSMHHNLEWTHALDIEYDASTFDTDPFEPQPDGMGTIFPFFVNGQPTNKGFVELPYTLPQDFTLFIILREKDTDIWKKKLDWIAEHGGMALMITHPDYMSFNGAKSGIEKYPAHYYEDFLRYIQSTYAEQYWHALPRDIARHWRHQVVNK